MKDVHILVVGAGIGGLTAALALQHFGVRVSVFEQAPELKEIGAGVVITPQAMHALNFLGVGEALSATATNPSPATVRHYATGEILKQGGERKDYRAKYGADYLQAHRADLHGLLARAVLANDPDCVHLDHRFESLTQDATTVTARFENGAVFTGDALIGCDGNASRVRSTLFEPEPVVYTGQVAFRALAPMERLPKEVQAAPIGLYIGPGRLFLHYALRRQTIMNVIAIARQPAWQEEGWTIPATIEEFLELCSDFHPTVHGIIRATPPELLFKWGLRDREPQAQWTKGRATLLGDAAHPMTPFLGQGAVIAIEDGMVLGRCFAASSTVEEALDRYEAARKERGNGVQLASREQADALQGRGPDGFNPGRDAEDRGLYDYNPVTTPV